MLLACGWLITALGGCATSRITVQVTATPCAPSTPIGGTSTCGAIVITTDRAVYAPLDAVHVTISNQLPHLGNEQYLVILTGVRGCPLARAQRLQGSVWEDVPVCLTAGGGGGGPSTAGERQIPSHRTGHSTKSLPRGTVRRTRCTGSRFPLVSISWSSTTLWWRPDTTPRSRSMGTTASPSTRSPLVSARPAFARDGTPLGAPGSQLPAHGAEALKCRERPQECQTSVRHCRALAVHGREGASAQR